MEDKLSKQLARQEEKVQDRAYTSVWLRPVTAGRPVLKLGSKTEGMERHQHLEAETTGLRPQNPLVVVSPSHSSPRQPFLLHLLSLFFLIMQPSAVKE